MRTFSLGRRAPTPAILCLLILCALFVVLVVAGAASAAVVRCDDQSQGSFVVSWGALSDGSGAAGAPFTDGTVVVWADDRAGTMDIYSVDVESGDETTVYAGPGDQTDPVVSDGQVYWIDRGGAAPSVWTIDPDTGAAVQVSADGVAVGQLAAGDSFVAWSQDNGGTTGWDIVGVQPGGADVQDVCTDAGDQIDPAVSDSLVAWEDHRAGNADIWAASLDSGDVFPVCEAAGDQVTPSAYDDVVVWADDRSGQSHIYGANVEGLWGGGGGDGGWRRISHVARCDGEQDTEFIVTDAAGEQTQPVISGPKVFWTDQTNGAAQSDIMGVDLDGGDPFVVTDAAGAQTDPTAGADGDYVAWLDAGGAKPVIAGGTVDWSDDGGGGGQPGPVPPWTTDKVVTLFLGVLSDYGVFDEVRFAVDDGAFGDWQSLSDTEAVTIPAHDGAHVIHVQLANTSFDAGTIGSEADPFPMDFTTVLDTTGPTTKVQQPAAVRSGRTASVKYKIADNLSPKADAQLWIRNRGGKVVQVVSLGQVATKKVLVAKVLIKVKRGHYTMTVRAKDLAGNTQRKAGAMALTVK